MIDKRLCVFGACNVLNCSIDQPSRNVDSWPGYAANELNWDYENFAQKSIDNNYIFHTVLSKIQRNELLPETDVLLIAWCDISSRLFLYNEQKNAPSDVLDYSLIYGPGPVKNTSWIRSNGRGSKGWDGEFNYQNNFGNPYYDTYFTSYHDKDLALLETIQKTLALGLMLEKLKFKFVFASDKNFVDSTEFEYTSMLKTALPWFLPDQLGIVECVKKLNLCISGNDQHPNLQGHRYLSEKFVKYIKHANTI